jgi:hydrogenase maturation protein HypF
MGGDLATRYPLRIAAAILSKETEIDDWLTQYAAYFPHGETEVNLILSQLKTQDAPKTTSLGRILDAAAAILGICYERTYEGEAAMKLESAASKGKEVLRLASVVRGKTLDTTHLLMSVFESRNKFSKEDLAYSVHSYLAKGLATLAVEKAVACGVGTVGFTGGAAVNALLTKLMRETVEAAGIGFLVHEAVPSGDGGVSLGQAVVGGFGDF